MLSDFKSSRICSIGLKRNFGASETVQLKVRTWIGASPSTGAFGAKSSQPRHAHRADHDLLLPEAKLEFLAVA